MGIRRLKSEHSPTPLVFPRQLLKNRYELEDIVGRGSFGAIYRAWDCQRSIPVAIKQAHENDLSCDILFREASILSSLAFPAIPTYLDSFTLWGKWYLVEEWRSGSVMSSQRSFSFERVLWIGQQCCRVLAYLHANDLVHRDLNPNNMLLAEDDTLTLLDFGCTRFRKDSPVMEGTPGYVAPEQWARGLILDKADIYSLGMVLGCALTDCKPQDVRAAGGAFCNLWDNIDCIPQEVLPFLRLVDRMIARRFQYRPDLAEISSALGRVAQAS